LRAQEVASQGGQAFSLPDFCHGLLASFVLGPSIEHYSRTPAKLTSPWNQLQPPSAASSYRRRSRYTH